MMIRKKNLRYSIMELSYIHLTSLTACTQLEMLSRTTKTKKNEQKRKSIYTHTHTQEIKKNKKKSNNNTNF